MNTPPSSPGPASAATAQQLTEQVQYLTARFADLESALTESERLRREQAEEIRNLRASAAMSSGAAGTPARTLERARHCVPSSGSKPNRGHSGFGKAGTIQGLAPRMAKLERSVQMLLWCHVSAVSSAHGLGWSSFRGVSQCGIHSGPDTQLHAAVLHPHDVG